MGDLKQFRDRIGYPQQDTNAANKFGMEGGLDVEETTAGGVPGLLIYCNNYEPSFTGGYSSKAGLEPVDGRIQPSAFVYQAVQVTVTNAANLPAVGSFVGVGGVAVTVGFLGIENVGGVNYFIFTCLLSSLMTSYYPGLTADTNFRGGMTAGVALGGGSVFGTTATSAALLPDNARSYYYIAAARALMRTQIKAVGLGLGATGKALGVADWNTRLFAFRNNNTGSAANLYVASANQGWLQINLGFILYYTSCNKQINVGDTITGATSGASLVVANVINMFGTVGGGDAAGYVVAKSVGLTFNVAGENLQVAAVTVAKAPASGNIQVANALPPGGSYRFRRWNFTGIANNIRLYGCNGVGTAFEISALDNSTSTPTLCFTPLITGVGLTSATFNTTPTTDTPTALAAWQDQLFLAQPGGNLLHSGYQTPTNWTAVQGADTRALGEDITNMVEDVNNALMITTRTRVRMLYGDVNENFQLRDVATTFGAFANTAARINGTTFLTDEGVQFADQTARFGNFSGISLSQPVRSLLKALMNYGAGPIEATISRNRSLYRLYFDGGSVLSFCIVGNQPKGIGLCNMGQNLHNFWSVASTVLVNDTAAPPPPGERIYCCGDDGYVYQDDVGATFGALGTPINTAAQTQFYYGDANIDNLKIYRRVYLDVIGVDVYTNLQVGAEYDDGYGYRTPEALETITRALAGSVYDQSSLYGVGFYGGAGKNVLRKEMHGTGVALSLIFASSSSVAFPHTIQAASVSTSLRARRHWR